MNDNWAQPTWSPDYSAPVATYKMFHHHTSEIADKEMVVLAQVKVIFENLSNSRVVNDDPSTVSFWPALSSTKWDNLDHGINSRVSIELILCHFSSSVENSASEI